MPEIIKDGKHYWTFPGMPYQVDEQMRALLNFYLRTHPETGALDIERWSVYPNNSTARKLAPLLTLLQNITDRNVQANNHSGSMRVMRFIEINRWQKRLDFYHETVGELMATAPDVSAGNPDIPASMRLFKEVVQPLFLGWYPNELEPFASQPGPFSSQGDRAVMDLYSPYMMANQLHVTAEAQKQAYEKFKQDLIDNATKIFTEHLPVIPLLNLLPVAIALAVGMGIYNRIKK